MAVNVMRYAHEGTVGWGVVDGDTVRPVAGDHPTTGDFMTGPASAVRAGEAELGDPVDVDRVTVLCPITTNQQFICQAVNYRSHMSDSGLSPESSPFNIFFRKALVVPGPGRH